KGGLETVAKELSHEWVKHNYGKAINICLDVGQDYHNPALEYIFDDNGNKIGYIEDQVIVYLIPAIDIVSNFPLPKIWTKQCRFVLKQAKLFQADVLQTHTRFFLSSWMGGVFARKNKIKWVHIEHGSDYVKLGSKFKTFVAYLYDKTLGSWTLRKADKVVAISNACKKFLEKEFHINNVQVIYRGLDFPTPSATKELKNKFPKKIIIGYVGRIYKWKNVHSLIQAYYSLNDKIKGITKLVIVGDGEELSNLKNLDKDNLIEFTGGVDGQKAIELQSQFDIHIHSSSPGGGLATTLLQAMELGCLIIATPNEGANEVITNGINGILLGNDTIQELKKGIEKGIEMSINQNEIVTNYRKINKEIIEKQFRRGNNIKNFFEMIVELKGK
ncbi:MAG: glycosyltransferase family 4 protein, partial [Candidatus Absconditabacteria bacterium]